MRAVYRQWMQQDVKRSAAESYSPLSLIFLFFFFSFSFLLSDGAGKWDIIW